MIALKEKNNSQGLYDMGICGKIGIGTVPITDEKLQQKMKDKWNIKDLNSVPGSTFELMTNGKIKNMFIFGEDPLGCAINKTDVKKWLQTGGFILVQDYFLTETAEMADLILPASFLAEMGGTYANTQRFLQRVEAAEGLPLSVEQSSITQLIAILTRFGKQEMTDVDGVMSEVVSLLPENNNLNFTFTYTEKDNNQRIFNYGCDSIVKSFEDYFSERMKVKLN